MRYSIIKPSTQKAANPAAGPSGAARCAAAVGTLVIAVVEPGMYVRVVARAVARHLIIDFFAGVRTAAKNGREWAYLASPGLRW